MNGYHKHDLVVFRDRSLTIAAVITTAHHDGTLTMRTQHILGDDGQRMPGTPDLGYPVRLHNKSVVRAADVTRVDTLLREAAEATP